MRVSGVIVVPCVINSFVALVSTSACVKIARCIGYYYKAPVLERVILRSAADTALSNKILPRHIRSIEFFAALGSLRGNAHTAAEEIHNDFVFRNGAVIVVRERESRLQGEGQQVILID